MRELDVAAPQFAASEDPAENADRAEAMVREAAAHGARLVLLQELFESRYFCVTETPRHFALARPFEGHPLVARFAALARELGVVLPVPFFETAGQAHFNSVAVVDADGRVLGALPQEPHPAGPGLRGEVLLLARRHGVPGLGHGRGTDRRSRSAGTSGSRRPRGPWP